MTTRANAPDVTASSDSVETENPVSTPGWSDPYHRSYAKGGQREGAGAKPLPAEQKMVAFKIAALPADWEYLDGFIDQGVDPAQRTPGHLFRAAVQHLRLFAPNGPDKSFYTRDPATPLAPRTTPAVAREAARRGITKAEQINEMYAFWKAHHREEETEE